MPSAYCIVFNNDYVFYSSSSQSKLTPFLDCGEKNYLTSMGATGPGMIRLACPFLDQQPPRNIPDCFIFDKCSSGLTTPLYPPFRSEDDLLWGLTEPCILEALKLSRLAMFQSALSWFGDICSVLQSLAMLDTRCSLASFWRDWAGAAFLGLPPLLITFQTRSLSRLSKYSNCYNGKRDISKVRLVRKLPPTLRSLYRLRPLLNSVCRMLLMRFSESSPNFSHRRWTSSGRALLPIRFLSIVPAINYTQVTF